MYKKVTHRSKDQSLYIGRS